MKLSWATWNFSLKNVDIRSLLKFSPIKPTFIYALLGINTFIYLCLRAYYIPITHDEAGSFLEFVLLPLENIVLGNPPSSTNHILHTLLVKLSTSLLGNHVFFLRLPVLLAYGIYFFFSLRLLQRWTKDSLFWTLLGLIFLNIHPYLLEFFALSRGYGLGIACMVASVHFSLQYLSEQDPKKGIAAFVWAASAVYSNFVFGLYYVAVAIALLLFTVADWRDGHINKWLVATCKIIVSCSVLLAGVVWLPLQSLLESRAFYIGGETGWVADTVGSLIRWNLYGQSYFGAFDLEVFGGLFIGGMVFAFAWILWEKWSNREATNIQNLWIDLQFLALFWSVLIGVQCGYVWFGGGKYLIGRTALFLLPLALLFLFAFLMHVQHIRWSKVVAIGGALLLCGHFLLTANISKSREWSLDAATPPMLDFVEQWARAKEKPVSLGVHWLMMPSVEFYQYIAPSFLIEVYGGKELIPQKYDFYYVHEKHGGELLEGYRIVERFGDGRLWLLERDGAFLK